MTKEETIDWSASETSPAELWKNPLYPLTDRLLMADGAIAFERKVNRQKTARHVEQATLIKALIKQLNEAYSDNDERNIVRYTQHVDNIEIAMWSNGVVTSETLSATEALEKYPLSKYKWVLSSSMRILKNNNIS